MKKKICGSRFFAPIKSRELLRYGLVSLAIFFASAGRARSSQSAGGTSTSHSPTIEAAQKEAASYNGPVLAAISPIFPRQNQTITIVGKNFGSHSPFNGDVSFFEISDVTQGWNAGYSGDPGSDGVTVNVTEWTDTKIVVAGFTGYYGSGTWSLHAGDHLQISIWNAQSGGSGNCVIYHTDVQGVVPVSTVLPKAAPLRTLYSFNGGPDGGMPEIIQGKDGNFYGVTLIGGAAGYGTVFKISPTGGSPPTLLWIFTGGIDGGFPNRLSQGTDNNFYGTTHLGGKNGYGTVFKISSTGGTPTTLTNFTGGADGANPSAGLVQGNDGNFYGTTWVDGIGGGGTVFKMTSAGTLTTIHSFSGRSDGRNPQHNLIQGKDGNIYGAASFGGSTGDGTLFKVSPTGVVMAPFHEFNGSDGNDPGGLVQGSDGNIYGTTSGGGKYGQGTIFKLNSDGSVKTVYSFDGGTDGGGPGGLIQGSDGNLYGVTSSGGARGYGTVFEITTSGVLTTVYSFDGSTTNGGEPGGIFEGSDDTFYGTTGFGGTDNAGTMYKLSLNTGPSTLPRTNGVDYGYKNPNPKKFCPDPQALYNDGKYFVIRYVSSVGKAKNLINIEARAFQQAGLNIILVYEDGGDRMLDGEDSYDANFDNGAKDANTASNVAVTAGAPQDFFCYFAFEDLRKGYEINNTKNAPASVQTAINAYLDGVVSFLGNVNRVGFYGGYWPLKRALDAGKASKGWQTSSFPGGIDWRISLYQYDIGVGGGGESIPGTSCKCDLDYGYGDDLGQWPVATPTITPNGGTFISSVKVTLNCITKDATIFYTTNGTDPTSSSIPYHNIPITLTSSHQLKAKAFKTNLAASAVAPATFTIIPPLTITTPGLSAGVKNKKYSALLATASGGTPPYKWSSSKLPAGLSLNPTTSTTINISGTPTKTGTFKFTVTVTDSTTTKKQTATQALTVTVN